MDSAGKAIILCAPSGAGKTTIVQYLNNKIEQLRFSISATTRAKRGFEENGKDYYYLNNEDFKSRIASGEFYEWQEVYKGLFYGTLKSEVERIWSEGDHVIFDVDVLGGINLKKALGDKALAIFVSVKDLSVLKGRLIRRNTESDESLKIRLNKAKTEIRSASEFDYILLNDNLDQALLEAETIVTNFLHIK